MTSRSDCVPMKENRSRPTRRRLRFYPRKDSIPRSTPVNDGREGQSAFFVTSVVSLFVCGPRTHIFLWDQRGRPLVCGQRALLCLPTEIFVL